MFFSGMAVVSLIAVLVGFARTYFLAGVFRAPLPNMLIHIHGAVFTLWIILFVSQIGLVTARRLDLHPTASGTGANRKIPDVCRALNLQHCGPFVLNRNLGFRTAWKSGD
jgi:hypothetical protein